jgi:hypothetical protein
LPELFGVDFNNITNDFNSGIGLAFAQPSQPARSSPRKKKKKANNQQARRRRDYCSSSSSSSDSYSESDSSYDSDESNKSTKKWKWKAKARQRNKEIEKMMPMIQLMMKQQLFLLNVLKLVDGCTVLLNPVHR